MKLITLKVSDISFNKKRQNLILSDRISWEVRHAISRKLFSDVWPLTIRQIWMPIERKIIISKNL